MNNGIAFFLILVCGLGLHIATGHECVNVNGTRKSGTIKFQPTPDYKMETVNCEWKFSSPKQEPFLLVFHFQRLSDYDPDDRITLPDGKDIARQTVLDLKNELCVKFIRHRDATTACLVEESLKHCTQQAVRYSKEPFRLSISSKPRAGGISLNDSHYTNFILIYQFRYCKKFRAIEITAPERRLGRVMEVPHNSMALTIFLVVFFVISAIVISFLANTLRKEYRKSKRKKSDSDTESQRQHVTFRDESDSDLGSYPRRFPFRASQYRETPLTSTGADERRRRRKKRRRRHRDSSDDGNESRDEENEGKGSEESGGEDEKSSSRRRSKKRRRLSRGSSGRRRKKKRRGSRSKKRRRSKSRDGRKKKRRRSGSRRSRSGSRKSRSRSSSSSSGGGSICGGRSRKKRRRRSRSGKKRRSRGKKRRSKSGKRKRRKRRSKREDKSSPEDSDASKSPDVTFNLGDAASDSQGPIHDLGWGGSTDTTGWDSQTDPSSWSSPQTTDMSGFSTETDKVEEGDILSQLKSKTSEVKDTKDETDDKCRNDDCPMRGDVLECTNDRCVNFLGSEPPCAACFNDLQPCSQPILPSYDYCCRDIPYDSTATYVTRTRDFPSDTDGASSADFQRGGSNADKNLKAMSAAVVCMTMFYMMSFLRASRRIEELKGRRGACCPRSQRLRMIQGPIPKTILGCTNSSAPFSAEKKIARSRDSRSLSAPCCCNKRKEAINRMQELCPRKRPNEVSTGDVIHETEELIAKENCSCEKRRITIYPVKDVPKYKGDISKRPAKPKYGCCRQKQDNTVEEDAPEDYENFRAIYECCGERRKVQMGALREFLAKGRQRLLHSHVVTSSRSDTLLRPDCYLNQDFSVCGSTQDYLLQPKSRVYSQPIHSDSLRNLSQRYKDASREFHFPKMLAPTAETKSSPVYRSEEAFKQASESTGFVSSLHESPPGKEAGSNTKSPSFYIIPATHDSTVNADPASSFDQVPTSYGNLREAVNKNPDSSWPASNQSLGDMPPPDAPTADFMTYNDVVVDLDDTKSASDTSPTNESKVRFEDDEHLSDDSGGSRSSRRKKKKKRSSSSSSGGSKGSRGRSSTRKKKRKKKKKSRSTKKSRSPVIDETIPEENEEEESAEPMEEEPKERRSKSRSSSSSSSSRGSKKKKKKRKKRSK